MQPLLEPSQLLATCGPSTAAHLTVGIRSLLMGTGGAAGMPPSRGECMKPLRQQQQQQQPMQAPSLAAGAASSAGGSQRTPLPGWPLHPPSAVCSVEAAVAAAAAGLGPACSSVVLSSRGGCRSSRVTVDGVLSCRHQSVPSADGDAGNAGGCCVAAAARVHVAAQHGSGRLDAASWLAEQQQWQCQLQQQQQAAPGPSVCFFAASDRGQQHLLAAKARRYTMDSSWVLPQLADACLGGDTGVVGQAMQLQAGSPAAAVAAAAAARHQAAPCTAAVPAAMPALLASRQVPQGPAAHAQQLRRSVDVGAAGQLLTPWAVLDAAGAAALPSHVQSAGRQLRSSRLSCSDPGSMQLKAATAAASAAAGATPVLALMQPQLPQIAPLRLAAGGGSTSGGEAAAAAVARRAQRMSCVDG